MPSLEVSRTAAVPAGTRNCVRRPRGDAAHAATGTPIRVGEHTELPLWAIGRRIGAPNSTAHIWSFCEVDAAPCRPIERADSEIQCQARFRPGYAPWSTWAKPVVSTAWIETWFSITDEIGWTTCSRPPSCSLLHFSHKRIGSTWLHIAEVVIVADGLSRAAGPRPCRSGLNLTRSKTRVVQQGIDNTPSRNVMHARLLQLPLIPPPSPGSGASLTHGSHRVKSRDTAAAEPLVSRFTTETLMRMNADPDPRNIRA
jgi:hypothetical protein